MRSRFAPLIAAAAAVGLTACAATPAATTPAESTSPAASSGSFPVSVKHAWGTTEIATAPQRVATVAWANHDAVLALGVVPVGFATSTYGVTDDSGLHEWTAAKLKELGAATPALFDETDGINMEAVAATTPDVILGALSGITEAEYKTLGEIAPTVAYPGLPWGTTWRDTIRTNAAALAMDAQAETLITSLESQISAETANYPSVAGKSAAFLYINPTDFSKVSVYTTHDARAAYLNDLGLTTPESVSSLSKESESFFVEFSAEKADVLADIDIAVIYGEADTVAKLKADPLLGKIPAIARGSVVAVKDGSPLSAAISPPSALSLTWGLKEYLTLIGAAADKVS